MSRPSPLLVAAAIALAASAGLAGCGLKGALTLPEKSGNVVIRGQSGAGQPAPTETKLPPADPDKLPPPDLPHTNSGSSR
jgi:predicted small lipoprotein YifL